MEADMETFDFEKTRAEWLAGDTRRDAGLRTPEDIKRLDDLSYGSHGRFNQLDIYYPRATAGLLPVILNVHGGGYFYGSKEIYQYYCMDLARRGFLVVNGNYRLAPEARYPAPLEDFAAMLNWFWQQRGQWPVDWSRLYAVGDSAGGQLVSQLMLLLANPEYAALFRFQLPPLRFKAVGLNCGMYDLAALARQVGENALYTAYLGPEPESRFGRQLEVLAYIDERYPAASIITGAEDFLSGNARPMGDLLTARGVDNQVTVYGKPGQGNCGHVFHVDIRNPLGRQCNDEQCAFFLRHA
ncbi:alpha/beta hydrolase [Oscillospiraceae bacterium HV4-5-C5C]|nr:alpha/beta hydrolase [Oscillospiraceae bacterium HV4-5-C5C]